MPLYEGAPQRSPDQILEVMKRRGAFQKALIPVMMEGKSPAEAQAAWFTPAPELQGAIPAQRFEEIEDALNLTDMSPTALAEAIALMKNQKPH